MRPLLTLLLAAALTLGGCEGEPPTGDDTPSTDGTLVISTTTGGSDPDTDGYQLTVDGSASRLLAPTETAVIILPAGPHTLALGGVAEQCTVQPGTSIEVMVAPRGRTSVAFAINCVLTGARITTSTTGLDLDPDGYRVEVDGADRGVVAVNGIAQVPLAPGSRTVGLTGLAANCAIDGLATRTVTIVDAEPLPIDFAIVCTATHGLIRVVVQASGRDVRGVYKAIVDGAETFRLGAPASVWLIAVPGGNHIVSLIAPYNCTVETDPQSVAVSAGGLVRDTVDLSFAVTCVRGFATLRITARTTGTVPESEYYALGCPYSGQYCGDWPLGRLAPNGTLYAQAPLLVRRVKLTALPPNCIVKGPNPSPPFTLVAGDTSSVYFEVACSP